MKKSQLITREEICANLREALRDGLRKVTLSKPVTAGEVRCTGRVFDGRDGALLQLEHQSADGKVRHRNIPIENAAGELAGLIGAYYRQMNLFTASLSVECKAANDGRYIWIRTAASTANTPKETEGHDRVKKLPFPEGEPTPFLEKLGVMDSSGKVYHKAYDKFRQINRFVQFIEDIRPYLPRGVVRAVDLCCGKGYLTFAAYAWLTGQGLDVRMSGVDRKKDVIELCNNTARSLGFDGLRFETGEIGAIQRDEPIDLAISLHACDTATDIALCQAVRWEAGVILSSPCCHKDFAKRMDQSAFPMMLQYPILFQRYAEMLTDTTRAEVLKLYGYQVSIMEFISLEHTQKNILIQAIKRTSAKRADEDTLRETLEKHGLSSTLWEMLKEPAGHALS